MFYCCCKALWAPFQWGRALNRTWILWLVTLQKSWWKTWWLVSGWIIASQKHGLESCCEAFESMVVFRFFAALTEYLYFWQEVCLAYQEKHLLTIQFDPAYKDDLHIRTIDEVLHVTYKEHPHIVSFSWWHCLWLCVGGDGESGQGWRLSFIYYVILLSICPSAQSSAHVCVCVLVCMHWILSTLHSAGKAHIHFFWKMGGGGLFREVSSL